MSYGDELGNDKKLLDFSKEKIDAALFAALHNLYIENTQLRNLIKGSVCCNHKLH